MSEDNITEGMFITLNDQKVHIHEEGDPNKPPVILIHGWSSSWYALSPLLPVFEKSRYHILAVDLPGFGDSPAFKQRATIPAYAELLAELIRQMGDQPATLVGHSMGGMISIELTLRYPELVDRMVLLDPTISGKLSTSINLFISPIVLLERLPVANVLFALLEPRLFALTDRLMRPISFADRTMISDEEYHHLRADARRPFQGRVRAECFWAMRNNDLRGKIGNIKTPTLMLWGMEDNTVPLRDAGVVADEWPDADLRIIPNSGHWPHFEKPNLTRRYVKGFMSTPSKLLNSIWA
jgi:pimeloyl-ACP methyl ester carboxylesterase